MERLIQMLGHKRPHGSKGEEAWVREFIMDKYPHTIHEGNVVIITDSNSTTLFSAHTDTVHHEDGPNDVQFDKDLMMVWKDDNTPLGADDGAGVWLLLELIDAGVPGTFVFHRGEERGGLGSRWMKENRAELLKGYRRAIAFDRRGRGDVITHQGGTECCSPEFALALCTAMDLEYKPCSGGVFTDTKNYIGLIPECTNLSVGYDREHSRYETQDVEFLMKLRERAIAINWEDLPTVRTPKEPVYGYRGRTLWGGNSGRLWDDDDDDFFARVYGYTAPGKPKLPPPQPASKIVPFDQSKDRRAASSLHDEFVSANRRRLADLWVKLDKAPGALHQLTYQEMSDLAWDDAESFAEVVWNLLKIGTRNAKTRG